MYYNYFELMLHTSFRDDEELVFGEYLTGNIRVILNVIHHKLQCRSEVSIIFIDIIHCH